MSLGKVAYDAYYEAIGGKSVKREWESAVTPGERGAWESVGQAVAGALWDAIPNVGCEDSGNEPEPLL